MMRSTRRARGFTLIEMVVATIVLFVGGVAAMMCISSATRLAATGEQFASAGLLGQQRLAELEADPTQLTSGDQQGDFGEDYPGYTWSCSTETTEWSDLLKVTLTVEWRSGTASRSVEFVTYMRTTSEASQTGSGGA